MSGRRYYTPVFLSQGRFAVDIKLTCRSYLYCWTNTMEWTARTSHFIFPLQKASPQGKRSFSLSPHLSSIHRTVPSLKHILPQSREHGLFEPPLSWQMDSQKVPGHSSQRHLARGRFLFSCGYQYAASVIWPSTSSDLVVFPWSGGAGDPENGYQLGYFKSTFDGTWYSPWSRNFFQNIVSIWEVRPSQSFIRARHNRRWKSRYQDGRKMWTNIITSSRNLAQMVEGYFPGIFIWPDLANRSGFMCQSRGAREMLQIPQCFRMLSRRNLWSTSYVLLAVFGSTSLNPRILSGFCVFCIH